MLTFYIVLLGVFAIILGTSVAVYSIVDTRRQRRRDAMKRRATLGKKTQ